MNVWPKRKARDAGLLVCVMVWLHRFFSLTVERLVLGLGERDSAFLARFRGQCSVSFSFACRLPAREDLIGGAEDLLCALFGDCVAVVPIRGIEPVLDIASAIVGAFEVQRFAAQQGDCFRFDFAQVLWRSFCVCEVGFGRVA